MTFLEHYFQKVNQLLPDNLLNRIKPVDLRNIVLDLGTKLYTDVSEKATGYSAYQVWLQLPGNAGKTEAQYFEAIRGLKPRGAWQPATAYAQNDAVENGGNIYVVTTAHTSAGSFSTANLQLFLQGATVADGAIVTNKVAEGAILPTKTSFIKTGKNLFNKDDAGNVALKYVNAVNGNLENHATYAASHFVPVTAGQWYRPTIKNQLAFYDAGKTFISGLNSLRADTQFQVPVGAVYVRLTVDNVNTFQLESGTVATTYESYRLLLSGVAASLATRQVTGENIALKGVDVENVRFITTGKNLFNKSDLENVPLKYILYTTGTLENHGTYTASHYIPVTEGQWYRPSFRHQLAFYSAGKTFLSGLNSSRSDAQFQVPVGGAFVRLTVDNINSFQLEAGSAATAYESYRLLLSGVAAPLLEKQVKGENLDTNSVDVEKVDFAVPGKNLFNKNAAGVQVGYYIFYTTGVPTANVNYAASDYIPVTAGQWYYPNFKHQLAFYNANKVYVSGLNSTRTDNQFQVPVGCAYVRLTVNHVNTFQLEAGTEASSYQPFVHILKAPDGTPFMSSYSDALAEEFLLFLPDEIGVAVGRTIELYNSQVSWCGNVRNYHFHWSGVGRSMRRKWSMTGTSGAIGEYVLTLRVYNNNMQQVATATTTVKVVSNVISVPFTACPIGDSLSNNKPWYAEVTTLSGNQITFVGTRGGGKHEGRSGAAASYYQGNNSYTYDTNGIAGNDGRPQNLNPFWNPNTSAFDFAYYKSNYNQNPGRLILWLGTNGISLDPAANVAAIKAFVDGVRATDAAIKIHVIFTLFRGNQDGIGMQLVTDGYVANTAWKLEEDRKVFNLQVALYNALKSYTNLYFVPVSLCHDSEFNFGAVATPVNPRAAQTESLPSEATHPQNQGYMQIADIIFSSLAAH